MNPDEVIREFEIKLIENMEDLDPEFQKVIDDNYWELISDSEDPSTTKQSD